jgi:hypothetical protein
MGLFSLNKEILAASQRGIILPLNWELSAAQVGQLFKKQCLTLVRW